MNTNGTVASADLGNSSNYSNEIRYVLKERIQRLEHVCEALKIVVGKVFLRVALMQELVGPKYKGNTVKVYRTKGNQVNIPEPYPKLNLGAIFNDTLQTVNQTLGRVISFA